MRPLGAVLLFSGHIWAAHEVAEIDVRVIVSGELCELSLGSGGYRAVIARLRRHTDAYLDVLERSLLPRLDDEGLATLQLGRLLRLARPDEPVRVRQIAALLRERAALALLRCPRDSRTLFRLQARFADYAELAR